MKVIVLVFSFLFSSSHLVNAECINPRDYNDSVVMLTGFNEHINKYISGTAWFYKNSKTLVTAGHVASSLLLSDKWSRLKIQQRKDTVSVSEIQNARLIRIGNISKASETELVYLEKYAKEDLAIIELSEDFQGAKQLEISEHHPLNYSLLYSVAYPEKRLVFAKGQSLPPSLEAEYIGITYQSMMHINMRNPEMTSGSSGAPILNCHGKAAGIITIQLGDVIVVNQKLPASGVTIIKRKFEDTTNLAIYSSFLTELMRREK